MEQYFKTIIIKRRKIEGYQKEIKELDAEIDDLREPQKKVSDELLKENKKLTELTEKDKMYNAEILVNLTSILKKMMQAIAMKGLIQITMYYLMMSYGVL